VNTPPPQIRDLGLVPYQEVWQRMQAFTASRDTGTADEIWFVQHPPVFTQGVSGRAEHVLEAGDIPVITTDRGGQVTYHGPGQWVVYVLLDIRRLGLNVRDLVHRLEDGVIALLAGHHVAACARPDAPGVYVNGAKIASLGLRVTRGRSYHGLALNVDMDLEPFSRINPCGYAGQKVTRMRELVPDTNMEKVRKELEKQLLDHLGYKQP